MPIEFPCPGCQKTLRVGDQHAGKQARCPHCQTVTPVPQGGGPSQGLAPAHSPLSPATTSGAGADRWKLRIDDGREFGPVNRAEMDRWMAEGRVTPSSQLQREGEIVWRPATEIYPALATATTYASAGATKSANPFSDPAPYQSGNPYAAPFGIQTSMPTYLKPHRGGEVLTFGILSFVCCVFFGIAAWSMGASDLREMRAGTMDPSGRGLTQAGMIVGIVSVVLTVIGIAVQVLIIAAH